MQSSTTTDNVLKAKIDDLPIATCIHQLYATTLENRAGYHECMQLFGERSAKINRKLDKANENFEKLADDVRKTSIQLHLIKIHLGRLASGN